MPQDVVIQVLSAEWCANCDPYVHKLERYLDDVSVDIVVTKATNNDEMRRMQQNHQIMSLPTCILWVDGVEAKRWSDTTNDTLEDVRYMLEHEIGVPA